MRIKGEEKKSRNIAWRNGKVTYEDRCYILGQEGLVVWFTGISGAGKSTIAVEVERELVKLSKCVYRLDGDDIRHGICSDLDFTEADRNENIRRIAETAALLKDAGLIVLVSCISPYKRMREFAREKVGTENFIEVYVKADVETCIKRDPKGLYDKALRGEIRNFTGLSSQYEEPLKPDLIIDTINLSIKESVMKVMGAIKT
jgi:adenylylsulfate kinase